MNAEPTVCAASDRTERPGLDSSRAARNVRRLQARIVKATQEGRWNKVKALQRLLTHSHSGRVLAVKRVTENQGGRTPGVDREQILVLVVRDRSGATAEAILPADNHQAIEAVLGPLVDRDAILVTYGGGTGTLALAARELGIAHRADNLNKGVRILAGVFHIQNANAYHSRLKGWMFRFHGVATKYLGPNLGWRRMLERFGDSLGPDLWLALAVGHYEG